MVFRFEDKYEITSFEIKETGKTKKILNKLCKKVKVFINMKKMLLVTDKTSLKQKLQFSNKKNYSKSKKTSKFQGPETRELESEKELKQRVLELWCDPSAVRQSKYMFSLLKVVCSEIKFMFNFEKIFEKLDKENKYGLPLKMRFRLKNGIYASVMMSGLNKVQPQDMDPGLFNVPG